MKLTIPFRHSKKVKSETKKIEGLAEIQSKILNENSAFSTVEAYKSARTNLLFLNFDDKCQKIVFTSSNVDEGKSLTCVNSAIALSQNGKKVLVIDCDMRNPTVNKLMNMPLNNGLSECLASITSEPNLRETRYNNLFVLTSGRIAPNPAELLSSERMDKLLESLTTQFDIIILDTPPVNVVTDAVVLSRKVNGYILVVRSEVTTIDALKNAVFTLEQVGGNIIGFLLNDVNMKSGKYGKYNNYNKNYYGKYNEQK